MRDNFLLRASWDSLGISRICPVSRVGLLVKRVMAGTINHQSGYVIMPVFSGFTPDFSGHSVCEWAGELLPGGSLRCVGERT